MKKIGLIAIFLTAPAICLGAEQTLTLREAIGRAQKENPQVRAAAFRQQGAQEAHAATRSAYLPRLDFDTGAVVSDTPSSVFMMKMDEGRIDPASDFSADRLNHPGARGDFRTELTLQQPLFDLGIVTAAAMSGKAAESAGAALQLYKEQVALRVYEAYLEVRRSKAYLAVAVQALADAREHLRLTLLREQNGVGLKSDELRARTEVAQTEQRLLSARNDHLLARQRLNLVVGGVPGETMEIPDGPPLAEPQLSEQELVARAMRLRPDLAAMERQVEKATLSVTQARQSYLPTVYASASYRLHDRDVPFGADKESWSAGMNLRWEIFDGTRRSHLVRVAQSSRGAAQAYLSDLRREATLQVTESLLRRQESELQLVTARQAVQDAEEGNRLVQRRFENGLSTVVELMDAESSLNAARANLVETENRGMAALARVYFAAGIFLQEVMR